MINKKLGYTLMAMTCVPWGAILASLPIESPAKFGFIGLAVQAIGLILMITMKNKIWGEQ